MWELLLVGSALDHRFVRRFEVLRVRRLTARVMPALASLSLRT